MMRRLTFAAFPLALLLTLSACGGDDSDAEETGTPAADGSATSTEPVATPTDVPIPSPTTVPEDVVVIQVVNAGEVFAPLRSEFLELGETTITHDGEDYTGVSIAAIAERVGARDGAFVTIEGTRADNLRLGIIRFTVDELGETTVLTVTEGGHLDLASSFVPPEQWLTTVTGISFD